jgi:hypothetical protein
MGGERFFCLTELGDPGGGDLDHVAPTILGRSAAGRETVVLEVVQETDHGRLVHVERGRKVLLREAAVVASRGLSENERETLYQLLQQATREQVLDCSSASREWAARDAVR